MPNNRTRLNIDGHDDGSRVSADRFLTNTTYTSDDTIHPAIQTK